MSDRFSPGDRVAINTGAGGRGTATGGAERVKSRQGRAACTRDPPLDIATILGSVAVISYGRRRTERLVVAGGLGKCGSHAGRSQRCSSSAVRATAGMTILRSSRIDGTSPHRTSS